jgi:sulfur-oxidizing protein SoxY
MIRSIMTAAVLIGLAGPALAEEDEAAQAARWRELKSALFGDRAVIEDSNVVVLDAPTRALDASTVPIGVSMSGAGASAGSQMSGGVTKLWLVVDGNPSPVVGAFSFGPDGDPRSLRTRVRVDQYTLIHAVAETADGRLFSTAKYVKAAGGCSAPSTKDPQVAMSRLGEIRVRLEGGAAPAEGALATAQLLISHPNNNGMQMDQLTHNYIPPHYIQSVTVTYGGKLVFAVDADISMSEDPAITFGLRLDGDGPLHVEVKDSAKGDYRRDFALLKGS